MKTLTPFLLMALLCASPALASVRISDMSDTELKPEKITRKIAAAKPAALAPAEAESLSKAILKERSDTEIWLQTSPTSYLGAIARRDFNVRSPLTVGTDPGSDVRLADSTVKARHLRITVVGDSFRVDGVDPGAGFFSQGDSLRNAMLAPSAIRIGRFTLRLSHQHFPAIIVFDPLSPRFQEYKGLSWFPVDFGLRYIATLAPNPEPDTVLITSTHSQPRRAERAGWFVIDVKGKRCLLEANRLLEPGVGERSLSVFFRDETTGKDSYDVGRYIDPELLPDGRYVLDFNNAYNPACAVSPHYNCPIPPKFNRLKVAIPAGEKNQHYLH